MPIVADIPEEFDQLLERFREHFGSPAFEHFKRYVLGLILSENLTVEGINRIFIESGHPSNLNRFLTDVVWEQQELNDTRLDVLKADGALSARGCLAIDDTLSHKTGKKIEAVGILYDHSENRYVLAHNIVTAQFIEPQAAHHPVDFRLYLKKDHCQEKGIEFKTKIDLAKELVNKALEHKLNIEAVLFDSWFASKDFIKFLASHRLDWITKLKADRNVKIRGHYMAIGDFAETLPGEAFRRIEVGDQTYWVFRKTVDLKGVGKVRIFISHQNEDLSDSPSLFATNRLRWEGKKALRTYSLRWKIETFYRDAKQNLGLEDYQLRDLRGIKRHWYLVFVAYSLLVSGLLGVKGKRNPKQISPIGDLIAGVARKTFAGLVRWLRIQLENGLTNDQVCTLAFGR